jgi:hypothetical protein
VCLDAILASIEKDPFRGDNQGRQYRPEENAGEREKSKTLRERVPLRSTRKTFAWSGKKFNSGTSNPKDQPMLSP